MSNAVLCVWDLRSSLSGFPYKASLHSQRQTALLPVWRKWRWIKLQGGTGYSALERQGNLCASWPAQEEPCWWISITVIETDDCNVKNKLVPCSPSSAIWYFWGCTVFEAKPGRRHWVKHCSAVALAEAGQNHPRQKTDSGRGKDKDNLKRLSRLF